MNSKTLYAVIAVIAIIIVVAVAAVVMNSNNDSIKGTYELQEGSLVILKGDEVQKQELTDQKIIIESADDGFIKADWNGCKMFGAIEDGSVRFTSTWEYNDVTFQENGYAAIEDKVIYYTGMDVSMDGKITLAYCAVFVKEGAKVETAKQTPLLKTGQVFTSYLRTTSMDGETFESSAPYNMEVLDTFGSISVIKNTLSAHGEDYVFTTLGVRNGPNTMECGYESITGFSSIITDGEVAQINFSYSHAGHCIVEKIDASSTDKVREYVPSTELNGKVYKGTMYCMDSKGVKTEYSTTYALGDDNKGVFGINAYGDFTSYTIFASITPDSYGKGYYVIFSEAYDDLGSDSLDFVRGYISPDMSAMALTYVTFNSDKTVIMSKCTMKLTEENSILGTYDFVSMDSISGTDAESYEFGTPYESKFTVNILNDEMATGTFLGIGYVGIYSDGILKFMNERKDGYDYVSVKFYDGACTIRSIGITGETAHSHYVKCVKEGATKVEEIPAPVQIYKVGDSLTTFDTVAKSNGQDVSMPTGQKLECLYSDKGLYAFRLTTSSDEKIIINGYGTSDDIVRTCGYYDGGMATYSLQKHSDKLTCMDRECLSDNGNTLAFAFRMSPDGKQTDVPSFQELDGKTYSGNGRTYVLKDGVFSEYDWDDYSNATTYTFQKNNGSITTGVEGGNVVDMHIVNNADGSVKKVECYLEAEYDGVKYYLEYYGVFSDDGKVLKIYAFGSGTDGSSVVLIADTVLQEKH